MSSKKYYNLREFQINESGNLVVKSEDFNLFTIKDETKLKEVFNEIKLKEVSNEIDGMESKNNELVSIKIVQSLNNKIIVKEHHKYICHDGNEVEIIKGNIIGEGYHLIFIKLKDIIHNLKQL